MRKIFGLFAALVLVLATTSCGGGGTDPGGGGGGGGGGNGPICPGNTFCLTANNTFSPLTRSVVIGTTVTWQNDISLHNVVWDNAAGRSAALAGDGTGDIDDWTAGSHSRLFNTAGTFGFHCTIHPGMNGSLIVAP